MSSIHFKMINDQFGHACGDAVLSQLAEVIKANFRKSDLCFRYGGEEFILLLDDADISQAKHSAERLRQAIENELFIYNGEAHAITASFGCACFDACETLENFIVRADKALYTAKRNGRNQVITQPSTSNLQPCANAIEK